MAKIRLYTLAKEFGMASKELLNKLRANGILVKSALSTVDANIEEAARRIVLGPEYLEKKKAEEEAKRKAEEEAKRKAEEEARRKAEEEARKKAEAEAKKRAAAEAKRKKEAEAKKKAEEEAKRKAAEEARKKAEEEARRKKEAEKALAEKRARELAQKFAKPPVPGKKTKKKSKEKKKDVSKKQAAVLVPEVEKSQPKVTIIRADRDPLVEAKDIDKAIEAENQLLDIEESIQRRMGRNETLTGRKKIVRVSGDDDRPKPSASRGRGDRRFDGRGRHQGRKRDRDSRNAQPIGRRGRYKRLKKARLEARQEAEHAQQALERSTLRLSDTVTVSDLAKYMGVSAVELVKKLIGMGVLASVNQRIDFDTATLLAEDYGFKVEQEAEVEEDLLAPLPEHSPEELVTRPPVVTVMGHVDHGKTSLLDAIRKTNVVAGESGGITQHIGAYQVRIPNGELITFLDTPGHEAFTAMRAHGAQVTDIAVLVVAADDGVKPQTVEAISHARAADVPIIVALNKMDKSGVNPDRVYQELSQHNLIPEEWGGKTIIVKCSAKEGTGIDELLDMIVLQAEMMELKACPSGPGTGVVIESRLDRGRGPVATVLVNDGVIKVGDAFVAGSVAGRVRAMEDHTGKRVQKAVPAQPVEIMGFSAQPDVADQVRVVESEQIARQVAEKRALRRKRAAQAMGRKPSLEELMARINASEKKVLPVVLRADVVGSVAAVRESLEKLSNEEGTRVQVIFSGTGTITESDVMFASASGAIIVGFHVRPSAAVKQKADDEGVEIRLYSVIYKAVEEMEDILNGMLKPKLAEKVVGSATVRAVFSIPKVGKIAGSYVNEGTITRNDECRLIRDGVEVYVGRIFSLRRFRDDVKEVQAGYECGIRLENFQDIKEGDVIEAFRMEEVPRD